MPPEKAAQVRPSDTGADARWQSYYDFNTALDEEHAYNTAADTMRAQEREQTNQLRRQVLSSSSGPNQINPTVEAHHPDLEEAGVPHDAPAPRATRSVPYPYPAPYDEYAADGHPRAPAFSTFERLNLNQTRRFQPHCMPRGISQVTHGDVTYDRVRDNALGH